MPLAVPYISPLRDRKCAKGRESESRNKLDCIADIAVKVVFKKLHSEARFNTLRLGPLLLRLALQAASPKSTPNTTDQQRHFPPLLIHCQKPEPMMAKQITITAVMTALPTLAGTPILMHASVSLQLAPRSSTAGHGRAFRLRMEMGL